MAWKKTFRLTYLIAIELARKYTRSLIIGFFIGFVVSLVFWKFYPIAKSNIFVSADRIGLVGEYTPSSLPESIQNLISFGLTSIGSDGTVLPGLSASWEATNSGKTYLFHLQKNLVWHNGQSVTSHDINYNIRGATIVPDGDHTVVIHLQHPYSPFPALVSKPIFLPGLNGFGKYEVHGIELQGDTLKMLSLRPVGTTTGSQKIFTFYHTETQAIQAFKLGEIDELDDMSAPTELAHWGKVKIKENVKYNRIVSLFFKTSDPLLEDKKVRQALAYGLPDIAEERAWSPIPKTSWAYTDNVRKYTSDPKNAQKMLKDTALATSSASLTISTFPAYLDLAQAISTSWKSLGVHSTIKVESSAPDSFQVLLSAQDVASDPDQYPFWHSTQTHTNITGYVNVKVDKLLEDGRQESSQNERKKIYADFARRLVEDAPAIFLYYPKTYMIQRSP
jgi:peptide/nickel transport system substrate-binding protein